MAVRCRIVNVKLLKKLYKRRLEFRFGQRGSKNNDNNGKSMKIF